MTATTAPSPSFSNAVDAMTPSTADSEVAQPAAPFPAWTYDEIEELCWKAGVLTQVNQHGFRKAVYDAFWPQGFRLATISQDRPPFDNLFKLSLYVLGNRQRLGRCEMNLLVRGTMERIGLKLGRDECHTDVSGRRVVVSVVLPTWTRID